MSFLPNELSDPSRSGDYNIYKVTIVTEWSGLSVRTAPI